MSKASEGNVVKVHYTGKLREGEVFDTSEGRDPLEFQVGAGQVIPGFEKEVIGMEEGDKKTIEIPVNEAYGERRDEMVLTVEKDKLPPELDPKVGQQLQIPQQNNQPPVLVTVTEVTEQDITIDANHPLAGHDLIFDIELIEVK